VREARRSATGIAAIAVGRASIRVNAREARFKREIAPKLDAFLLKEIGKVTGLSLAACSRIRAGAKIPHPRHRERLLALVEAGN
jgi:hypothetical protein